MKRLGWWIFSFFAGVSAVLCLVLAVLCTRGYFAAENIGVARKVDRTPLFSSQSSITITPHLGVFYWNCSSSEYRQPDAAEMHAPLTAGHIAEALLRPIGGLHTEPNWQDTILLCQRVPATADIWLQTKWGFGGSAYLSERPGMTRQSRTIATPAWLILLITGVAPGMWLWARFSKPDTLAAKTGSARDLRLRTPRDTAAAPGMWNSSDSRERGGAMGLILRWLMGVVAVVLSGICAIAAALWIRGYFCEENIGFASVVDAPLLHTHTRRSMTVTPYRGVFFWSLSEEENDGGGPRSGNVLVLPKVPAEAPVERIWTTSFNAPIDSKVFLWRRLPRTPMYSPRPRPFPQTTWGFGTGAYDMNIGYRTAWMRSIATPAWLILLITGLPPGLWFWTRGYPGQARRRRSLGLCETCGYDLRATPERCPECGAIPSPAK